MSEMMLAGFFSSHPIIALAVITVLYALICMEVRWARPTCKGGYYTMTVCWVGRIVAVGCAGALSAASVWVSRAAVAGSAHALVAVVWCVAACVSIVLAGESFFRRLKYSQQGFAFRSLFCWGRHRCMDWSELAEVRERPDGITMVANGRRYNVHSYMRGFPRFETFVKGLLKEGRKGEDNGEDDGIEPSHLREEDVNELNRKGSQKLFSEPE